MLIPVFIGPPGTNIIGRYPNFNAPMSSPGTILSQIPRRKAESNMLCDKPIAVDKAMTSLENKDKSIPASPCVTPSHIAGTAPATCATAFNSLAYVLICSGYFS